MGPTQIAPDKTSLKCTWIYAADEKADNVLGQKSKFRIFFKILAVKMLNIFEHTKW